MFKDCTKEEILNIIKEMKEQGAMSITIADDSISVLFREPMVSTPVMPTDMDDSLWDDFIKSQQEEDN